mmetsp:Transcript_117890/g.176102  ORF Transcript_117890/g.176102 Transcript_117890/m.176102 type:complete len:196 (-) Transcript_117890:63-650(-)
MPGDYDEKFNIILLGDVKVGKTSLLLRFSEQEFITDFSDIDQKHRDVVLEGIKCRLILTDTAGQELFRTLTSSFFRNAHAMIFVYDITQQETFDNITGHFEDGSRYAKQALRFVVGNKTDLIKERVVTEKKGRELAEKLNVPFTETSAKSGEGVEDMFINITKLLLAKADDGNDEKGAKNGKKGKKNGKKDCIIS